MGHGEAFELGLFQSFLVYFSYGLLIFLGHAHDFLDKVFKKSTLTTTKVRFGWHFPIADKRQPNQAPLTSDFESFYARRLYDRIQDCWNRPITGSPGAWVDLLERKTNDPVWNSSFT